MTAVLDASVLIDMTFCPIYDCLPAGIGLCCRLAAGQHDCDSARVLFWLWPRPVSSDMSGVPLIKNTFCHLPGIGVGRERTLWDSGIQSWDFVLRTPDAELRKVTRKDLRGSIEQSQKELESGNPDFFASGLPAGQHWRLFSRFRDSIAYVDIETTGLDFNSTITTIALYDGKSVYHYVNGRNLEEFKRQIRQYQLIVTYNGKCFDVPFLERFFRIQLKQTHIDLRYLLKSLGYSGGLKACEARLGIDRGELEGVDGFFAVHLWHEYKRRGNKRALETLLAYNIEDVLNLEKLLTFAYNRKLEETPFHPSQVLSLPEKRPNPFKVDVETIRTLKKRIYGAWNV